MKYAQLIEYMHQYRLGRITEAEMGCAVHLWQRARGGKR